MRRVRRTKTETGDGEGQQRRLNDAEEDRRRAVDPKLDPELGRERKLPVHGRVQIAEPDLIAVRSARTGLFEHAQYHLLQSSPPPDIDRNDEQEAAERAGPDDEAEVVEARAERR